MSPVRALWLRALTFVLAGIVSPAAAQAPVQRIVVESPTLRDGQPIPSEYTADGRNTSPALTWRNVPSETKELLVALEDQDEHPEVATLSPRLHWVVYNIPPAVRELAAGFPTQEVITAPPELDGAFQAYTVFDRAGYRGPQPPPGQPHRYRFSVYALDQPLFLEAGMGANAVLRATAGRVIGEGSLTVTYERKAKP